MSRVIVYGGGGALGRAIVAHNKAAGGFVVNIDLASNEEADANVQVDVKQSWVAQEQAVKAGVASAIGDDKVRSDAMPARRRWRGGVGGRSLRCRCGGNEDPVKGG